MNTAVSNTETSVSEEAANAYCSSPVTGNGGYNDGRKGDYESAGSGGATHISLITGTYTSKLKWSTSYIR